MGSVQLAFLLSVVETGSNLETSFSLFREHIRLRKLYSLVGSSA